MPLLYTTAVYGPTVTIGGLSFNVGPDSNGVEWIISDEAGWYSTAGVNRPGRRNRRRWV